MSKETFAKSKERNKLWAQAYKSGASFADKERFKSMRKEVRAAYANETEQQICKLRDKAKGSKSSKEW